MATHFSVLAWRIPGMGKPGGLPPMGSHRARHDCSDLAAAAAVRPPVAQRRHIKLRKYVEAINRLPGDDATWARSERTSQVPAWRSQWKAIKSVGSRCSVCCWDCRRLKRGPGNLAFSGQDIGRLGKRMASKQAGVLGWAWVTEEIELNPEGDRKSKDLKQRRNRICFC